MSKIPAFLKRADLSEFCKRRQISKLSLFGSFSRGEETEASDLDLLVQFEPNAIVSLFDMVAIEDELSEMLGRKVDLRTPAELSRYFRERVVAAALELFAA